MIVTWGSRGDFQPYVSLAKAFQEAGHDVLLGTQSLPGFAELAASHGVELIHLATPHGPRYQEVADAAISLSDPLRAVRVILDELFLPAFEQMYSACLELARWADAMVCHFLQLAGRMAAEACGTPWVSSTLVPTQIPTGTRPPEGMRYLGRVMNRVVWRLVIHSMNKAWLEPINLARTSAGLPPTEDLVRECFYSPKLNLVAASPTVFPRPADWDAQHRMTGFWRLDTPGEWSAPATVTSFLAAGPPPVAIGFGAMTSANGEELTRTVLEAIELAGVRAVLDPGLAHLGATDLPDGVIQAPSEVGHAWLLPRVAAAVHHGGIGTYAAALQAGVPQVVVPHVFDQFTWAKQAERFGLAPPPVPLKLLNPQRLAAAISQAVQDKTMRRNAERVSKELEQENGAQEAVRMVEEFLSQTKYRPSA